MAHTLMLGIPESGKSTLARKLAAALRRLEFYNPITQQKELRRVSVLDSTLDRRWPADFLTDDPADFLEHCRSHNSEVIFVDESNDAFEHARSDLNWLGTRGRHLGYAGFFIGQGYPQVPAAVRRCCTGIYLFNTDADDAAILARKFNCPELNTAPTLRKGEFLYKQAFYHVRRGVINFRAGTVEIEKRRAMR